MSRNRSNSHPKTQSLDAPTQWRQALETAHAKALEAFPGQEATVDAALQLIISGEVHQPPGQRPRWQAPNGDQVVVTAQYCPQHGDGAALCACKVASMLLTKVQKLLDAAAHRWLNLE